MDIIVSCFSAVGHVLTSVTILFVLLGGVLGYIGGAIPGISASIALGLLVPLTFGMDPNLAIPMLVSVYMGAEYAGSIPAILINAPGTPGAVATAFDGNRMAKNGQAGLALLVSISASAIGSVISTLLLIITAAYVANVALAFGPAEFFWVAMLGLSLVSILGSAHRLRSLLSALLGLGIAMIGIDPITGMGRFAFMPQFLSGIPLLPVLIGLFAFSEALEMVGTPDRTLSSGKAAVIEGRYFPPFHMLFRIWPTLLKGSVIGYIIGAIPGAGTTIASFVSYAEAKRASKDPESFGKGNYEGVAASECANNAAVAGVIGPLLALGIPGSASAAILIGALKLYGLQPGPLLFQNNPTMPYIIFASLLLGVPILFAVGVLGTRLWARVVLIPRDLLAVVVIGLSVVGSYASNNDMFSVWVMLLFGVLGYMFRKLDIPLAPLVLAMVLGSMAETNFRRAEIIGHSQLSYLVASPMALSLMLLTALMLLLPILGPLFRRVVPKLRGRVASKHDVE